MNNVQNFIMNELYSSLKNHDKVNKQFEIIEWNELNSLFLQYKVNNKDGFIITTTPCCNENNICFNLTIIPVDSCIKPKPNMNKYFTNISNDGIVPIINYLTGFL